MAVANAPGVFLSTSPLLRLYCSAHRGTFTSASRECAVGFSAVLFALKVVANTGSPDSSVIYGVTVPTKVCRQDPGFVALCAQIIRS